MKKLLIIDDSDNEIQRIKTVLPEDYEVNSIILEIDSKSQNSVYDSLRFMWFCIKEILDIKPDILLLSAVNSNQRANEWLHICLLLKILRDYFGFILPKIISISGYPLIASLKHLYEDTDVKHFLSGDYSKLEKCLNGNCDC